MRKMAYLFVFICFVAVAAVPSALSTINGMVTDTDGAPVIGATVTFTDETDTDTSYSGMTVSDGAYSIEFASVGVEDERPESFSLQQNFPNPFNPTTTIHYSLDNSAHVSLIVFNVAGQKVRTLFDGFRNSGAYTAIWDGLDDRASVLGAGVYFYRLTTDGANETRKMLLLDGGQARSVAKPAAIHSALAAQAENMYTVTISADDIETYSESGVSIIDNGTYNYVVSRVGPRYIDVTSEEAYALVVENSDNPDFVIFDIRTPAEFDEVHLENAVNVNYNSETFRDELGKMDKNKAYLLHCLSGGRSSGAYEMMQELEFMTVYHMVNGIYDWISKEYPVIKQQ